LARQSRSRWTRRAFLVSALGLAAILVLDWRAVFAFLGNCLVLSEAPRSADLVLVLGGNFYGPRVLKGADLVAQGYAPLAFFSGPPYQGRPQGDASIDFLAQQGYSRRGLDSLDVQAESTIEEAQAVRPELIRRGAKRVLLVTASFHSRRSAIVFGLFCPGIQFISVPAEDPQYHPDTWWVDASSRKLFFSEWEKILGTVLVVYPRYLIGRIWRH
jgi:uncharacterized SAM-binding protein YcdF (DUF218 family)